ncbi:MAG: tetratricopeptide repeat protein [Fimbriimonadaceae bacterium]|nr:tetratricopeptide repeat protein [Fimbriimonadaceae bacterium]
MLDCTKCGKQNTLDGRYCRTCGTELPEDALVAARADNDQLLADGRKLLLDSRITEALLLAQTAHENDPSSSSAYALMGDCYERQSHLQRALECFEKALVLDPDASLEKIKVDHLRKVLSDPIAPPMPTYPAWRSWGAAIAAVVLVASVGTVLLLNQGEAKAETRVDPASGKTMPAVDKFSNDPTTAGVNTDSVPLDTEVEANQDAAGTASEEAKADEAKKPADEAGATEVKPKAPTTTTPNQPQADGPNTPRRESKPVDPTTVATQQPQLPEATSNGGSVPVDTGFAPMRPNTPRISIIRDDTSNQDKQPEKQPEKPKKTQNDVDPTPKKQDPKPFNPGMIDIRPSKDNPRTVGGSETVKDNSAVGIRPSTKKDPNAGVTGATALMKVAQQHMLTRNFAAAADAYEKALKAGASPLTAYQRLGQCYQEMGRRADAINAYSKAIRAMESALVGNPALADRLNVSIDACKKAIRVLGG